MTKKELYELFPSRMTARDLNNERGIYKLIPYVFPSSELPFKPLIRFTKSGYVLYQVNGFPQPFFVRAGTKVRRYNVLEEVYTNIIVSFVDNLLSGKAVLATTEKGDFIKCTDCGIMFLVPYGKSCPLCHEEGHNLWAKEEMYEADIEKLGVNGYTVYRAD